MKLKNRRRADAAPVEKRLLPKVDDLIGRMLSNGARPVRIAFNRVTHDAIRAEIGLPAQGTLGTLRELRVVLDESVAPGHVKIIPAPDND